VFFSSRDNNGGKAAPLLFVHRIAKGWRGGEDSSGGTQ